MGLNKINNNKKWRDLSIQLGARPISDVSAVEMRAREQLLRVQRSSRAVRVRQHGRPRRVLGSAHAAASRGHSRLLSRRLVRGLEQRRQAQVCRDGAQVPRRTQPSRGHIHWTRLLLSISLFLSVSLTSIVSSLDFNPTLQVLLYDIRSNKPYTVKDHRYELPIKEIEWHMGSDLVLSIDKRVCKIWDKNTVICGP